MMLSIRYQRFVPTFFRELRKEQRLAFPNQWLGSPEQTVVRQDEVFTRQVTEMVQRMKSAGSATPGADAKPVAEPAAEAASASPVAGQ